MKKLVVLCALAVAGCVQQPDLPLPEAPEAKAMPPVLTIAESTPAIIREAWNFPVTCLNTGAVAIAPAPDHAAAGKAFTSLYCENNGATSVFYGGSNVAAAAPNPCISTTTASCLKPAIDPQAAKSALYCITAAAPVTIGCIGGI